MENLQSELDPAAQAELTHLTAAVLLHRGHESDDPDVVRRLVSLADEMGLEVLADMWAHAPAVSLPGALWRLYVLREGVRADPSGTAEDFRSGLRRDEVSEVVAGVAEPPGPDEVRGTIDEILAGAYRGDFAVALERAAAFLRILALGRTERTPERGGRDAGAPDAALASSAALVDTADTLGHCAAAWRADTLD
nr:hypothetical protein [Spelaeicoccus albus]